MLVPLLQEIDTTTGAVVSIQAGMRLLRGKKPIYAMQVYQDLLFTAGAFVEGGGTKVITFSRKFFASIFYREVHSSHFG
jgi:hypothetical protein